MSNVVHCGNPEYKMVHFSWFFTDWCNYNCSYCSAARKMSDSFSKQTSPARYKMALAKLKMVTVPFKVEFLGGEPTLHPNMFDVVGELCAMENCKDIEIITNLSRSVAYFEKMNAPEYKGTRILASYHPEYFSQQFIDKSIALSKMEHLSYMVNINLSDQPADWPVIINLIETLAANNVMYGFNFLNSTPSWQANYTPEFFDTFAPYLNGRQRDNHSYTFADGTTKLFSESQIIEQRLDRFKGYSCTPLMYDIDIDGTIRNLCTRRVIPITMPATELIKNEICPLDHCSCDIMYNFYKEKQ